MKSQLQVIPKEKYPYLGLWNNNDNKDKFVVLFTEKRTGMVVYSECNRWSVGQVSSQFAESEFSHYTSAVVLSN